MSIIMKSVIIVLVTITTLCNAGYQRPIEIEQQPNYEIPSGYGGYKRPYNNIVPEVPMPLPSKYDRPQIPPIDNTYNPPPIPSEGPYNPPPMPTEQSYHSHTQIDLGGNSYQPPNIGYMNSGPMPYRSMGGYYRG
uniref:CG16743 protein n=1 Tax=Strongyloides stercoralis TaxID=6248 RepID=A0A0K0EG00_STRER